MTMMIPAAMRSAIIITASRTSRASGGTLCATVAEAVRRWFGLAARLLDDDQSLGGDDRLDRADGNVVTPPPCAHHERLRALLGD
jgi:hypothetical protein